MLWLVFTDKNDGSFAGRKRCGHLGRDHERRFVVGERDRLECYFRVITKEGTVSKWVQLQLRWKSG